MSSAPDPESVEKAKIIERITRQGRVTLPQMAKLAGLHYMTMRNHVKAGRLRTIRIGNRYYIDEDEVIRFLTQGNYIGPHTFEALAEVTT